jgi:hypothetical protein
MIIYDSYNKQINSIKEGSPFFTFKNISFQRFIAAILVPIFTLTTEFEKAEEKSYHIHVENRGGDDVFVRGKSLHDQTGVINDVHAVEDGKPH